jgi:hypothetical protein
MQMLFSWMGSSHPAQEFPDGSLSRQYEGNFRLSVRVFLHYWQDHHDVTAVGFSSTLTA